MWLTHILWVVQQVHIWWDRLDTVGSWPYQFKQFVYFKCSNTYFNIISTFAEYILTNNKIINERNLRKYNKYQRPSVAPSSWQSQVWKCVKSAAETKAIYKHTTMASWQHSNQAAASCVCLIMFEQSDTTKHPIVSGSQLERWLHLIHDEQKWAGSVTMAHKAC